VCRQAGSLVLLLQSRRNLLAVRRNGQQQRVQKVVMVRANEDFCVVRVGWLEACTRASHTSHTC
jgi:hypothetical protein